MKRWIAPLIRHWLQPAFVHAVSATLYAGSIVIFGIGALFAFVLPAFLG